MPFSAGGQGGGVYRYWARQDPRRLGALAAVWLLACLLAMFAARQLRAQAPSASPPAPEVNAAETSTGNSGAGNSSAGNSSAGNLIAGKEPVASRGVNGVRALTDGIAAVPGDDWETDATAQFAEREASVTYDLGAVVSVRALWFQADHNDDYRFMISEDGVVFETLWDAPAVAAVGLRDRSTSTLRAAGRYLRLEPAGGDGRYAVAELGVWREPPAAFPPELPRRRGTPLEVVVRTAVLMFAAATIACLVLAHHGAPRWWLFGCALLPLIGGLEALQAFLRAWPVEQRQVSIVRAACAAIAAAAVLREAFSPPRFPAVRGIVKACLGLSAVLSVLAFYNLGQPQFWDSENQRPMPVHVLDLRQYFGTVKYFDELGYRGLYAADIAAYVEDTPGATLDNMRDTPMRNLDTHRMSTVEAERDKIEAVRQRFSPERWQEYKKDARYFREVMGPDDYLHYMVDFGGNATPVWIGMAHLLFNPVSADTTVFLLTGLLDPLLFLATFAAIWRCFGFRTMAIVMVVFGANDFIMYGTNWGGATLRHDWLMFIGLGACALKRQRWALGGFLLALSAMIRAFPIVTLVSAAFPLGWWLYEWREAHGRWPALREIHVAQRPALRVLGSALVTGVLLLTLSAVRWSVPAWTDWLAKVTKLSVDAHGNSIALRGLIAGWEVGHAQLIQARWALFVAGLAFYVGMVLLWCRGKPLERAAMAGLILIPVVFYPANYYIHVVCFLPLLAVERRLRAGDPAAPMTAADAGAWLILLGLCVAQYWTVLVTDRPLHFHLATVLLFAALGAILVLLVRADVREGRLDFLVRFFGWSSPIAAGGVPPEALAAPSAGGGSPAVEPARPLQTDPEPREKPRGESVSRA